MKRANRRPKGFTLMEATVALAVFAIGMLGLAGSFSQIIRANTVSKQKQVGLLLAERKLADFRMALIGELAQTHGTFGAPFADYTWEAQFAGASKDLQIINVWVEVKHPSGTRVRLWSQIRVADGS